jgi:exodeoxyribonuclease V alpha subunit
MNVVAETDQSAKTEVLSGQIERITYRNDNDWTVLQVRIDRLRTVHTVVGHTNAQPGQQIVARGEWKRNPQYGVQFVAQAITATQPNTVSGLKRYLGSGMIPGIGPVTANSIVDAFGMETLSVLDNNPSRLSEVKGIGPKKAERIMKGWEEQRAVSEIMLFLNEQHIPPYLCRRIYRKYEAKSIEVIRTDPFRLALEVSGIGFKTADRIATQCGISPLSPQRIRAGLVYVMQEATTGGHCGLARTDLIQKATETLAVSPDLVVQVLDAEISMDPKSRHLVQHGDGIYLSMIAACEERVASTLAQMAKKPVPWKIDADREIDLAEKALGFKLAEQQREGVRMMLTNRVSVFTGGPGTGKSSSLNVLLHIFRKHKIYVHLAAPTGKAAQRAAEVTGVEASTIHRLLGIEGPGSEPGELEDGVLVIDESSMIDIYLMTSIVKAAKDIPLILVGDVDQLPSVGPGQVLADIINSGTVPVTRLTQVFRQAAGSLIIRNAHRINHGQMPEKGGKADDFFFITVPEKDEEGNRIEPSVNGERIASVISDLVADRLPRAYGFDPIRDIMVLSPMNITTTGVANLNSVLQERLNPAPAKSVMRFGMRFGLGDKVIQTRNNYDLDIFNGDVGIIASIHDTDESGHELEASEKKIVVDFGISGKGRAVEIPFDEMDALRPAYAITVHKCISGHQRVLTEDRGLVPIRDLTEGEGVITGEGVVKKVVGKFLTGRKPVVRITTKMGYQIDVSAEHPILVANDAGYSFVRAEDLTTDHYACISRVVVDSYKQPALPPIVSRHQNNGSRWAKKENANIVLPESMTEDLAWLLGVIIGDGSCSNKRDGTIELTNMDQEVLGEFRRIMSGYGLHAGEYKKKGARAIRLFVTSRPFREWLLQIGLGYHTAREKRIPEIIFRSPAKIRGAFLRGLFDTDGSVTSPNRPLVFRCVRLATSSQLLAKETQELLLSLGVVSTIRKNGEKAFHISVGSCALPVFKNAVGFLVRHKSLYLEKALERLLVKNYLDSIPFGPLIAKQCLDLSGRKKRHGSLLFRLENGQTMNHSHVSNLLEAFSEKHVDPPELLKEVSRLNYLHDRIASIEFTNEMEEMYDIEVDGIHSFVSKGFVCHNSQGSQADAVVIPVTTQHYTMLQRNLFYTGVTRAKKLVVLVGVQRALGIAIRNNGAMKRMTRLRDLLESER